MSRHALDSSHYTSTETLSLERQRLFGKLWTFVGFSSMARERNQFFTRTVAGVPVLIQRTDAGIRAFVNECPHRLSSIQTETSGKRPLVCPYHAWSFGPEGELRGIPNQGLYQFTAAEREKICLRKLHIEVVGQLLFLNMSDEPIAFEEQFNDEFRQQLEEVSAHLDDQIVYSCHRVRYNWKLNMENVKDVNHVPFVHPKSFFPVMEKGARPPEFIEPTQPSVILAMLERNESPALASLSYPLKTPLKPGQSWFAGLCEPYGSENAYHNWYIYPNVNFCSVKGEHFLLQQYDPVAPGETDYHLWMMTARRKDRRTDLTALLSTLIRAERAVIAEDTQVLERLQGGLGDHSQRFMHGDYEQHLVAQHLWYRQAVLGESA